MHGNAHQLLSKTDMWQFDEFVSAAGWISQDELLIVSNQAAASLTAGTLVRAGVSKATIAVMIRGDQKVALQATGAADLSLGNGFASASATAVGVAFNNTGADIVNRTVTVTVGDVSVSAPLNVKNGRAALVVTGLQAHQFLAGHLQAGWFGIALGVDRLVETLHFGDRITLQGRPIEQLLPAHQQFAELRAPIPDMVVADHPVTQQSPHPLQCITNARGPDMPHVHGLGDIGAAEVDQLCRPAEKATGYSCCA